MKKRETVEKEVQQPTPTKRVPTQRAVRGLAARRISNGLRGGGVLVGGLLAGGDLARRAIAATVLPTVRQITEAVVPAVVRTLAEPILAAFGRLVLIVYSPLTKLGLFFWLFFRVFDGGPRVLSALASIKPLAPLMPRAFDFI